MLSTGFPPVARSDARVLILGSLPGPESLRLQQYYGHPMNQFWRIAGEIAGAHPLLPYQDRLGHLVAHRIALWDTCHAAERPGALDQSILHNTVVPNNFADFLPAHPEINCILFNGAKAAELFARLVLPLLPTEAQSIARRRLPSTSPAHAGMRFAEKLARWRAALAR